MILVYFDGHGEWFFRDGNSLKLAVPRTTKVPYRDTRRCSDFEEWLSLKDNAADLAEWDHLYDSKNYQYDHYLKGIFFRNPSVEGDVFDTNGLRTFGPNYVDCPETNGVFRLTDKDEKRFRKTNFPSRQDVQAFNKQWDEFTKSIEILLPSDHPESPFSKMVKEGKLSDKDYDRVFFGIQTQQHFDYDDKSTPIIRKNELYLEPVDTDSEPANQNETSRTDREYLLRTIGALSLLLVEKTGGNKLGTQAKPNKLAIQREINEILSSMDLSTLGQSKSRLNDVLGEALQITLDE
jgi:hypothetical protein